MRVEDGVDGPGLGRELLLQDDPTLLQDDRLHVRVKQQDKVGHLRKAF